MKHLKEMLHRHAPAIEIVGTCKRLNEAKKWLEKNRLPDLVFSVVQLADGLSFEIFRQHDLPVIFTCAFDKYAFEAFKVHSVHFLKKPIKKRRPRRSHRQIQGVIYSKKTFG